MLIFFALIKHSAGWCTGCALPVKNGKKPAENV
jgi:hypothetical protein